jgi:hypothetical protein
MSNIKVGSKLFRDVEKMDLNQLGEVKQALDMEEVRLVKEGQKCLTSARVGVIQVQIDVLSKRRKIVEGLAKRFIKTAVPTPVV